MAKKRMFSIDVVDSDAFLDMPISAQALYFHLGMRADDDGFISNAKKVQRIIGASEDDFRVLLAKRFLLACDGGIVVIKHWFLNNSIRRERYTPTLYRDQKAALYKNENGVYTDHPVLSDTCHPDVIPDGTHLAPKCHHLGTQNTDSGCQDDTQADEEWVLFGGQTVAVDKDSIDKIRLDQDREDKNNASFCLSGEKNAKVREYALTAKKLFDAGQVERANKYADLVYDLSGLVLDRSTMLVR